MSLILCMMLCIWGGKDGYMLIRKLQNTIQANKKIEIVVKIIMYSIAGLVVLLGMLENDGSDVSFVYNNF